MSIRHGINGIKAVRASRKSNARDNRLSSFILCIALALIWASCSGESRQPEAEKTVIKGQLSYGQGVITSIVGVEYQSNEPEITGGLDGQEVNYTIFLYSNSNISIDYNTGVITIPESVAVGTHSVLVYAEGTGNYKGVLSTTVTISVLEEIPELIFFYQDGLTAYIGNPEESVFPPTISENSGLTFSYGVTSIESAEGEVLSSLPPGVEIGLSTGNLTVDGTQLTSPGVFNITVEVTGTLSDLRTTSEETVLSLNVARPLGTLSYGAVSSLNNAGTVTTIPNWKNEWDETDELPRSAVYTIESAPSGIEIDSDLGIISVDSSRLMDETVTVIAVGTGEFEGGSTESTVSIVITDKALVTGEISYADGTNTINAEYGVSTSATVSRSGGGIGETIEYKLSPEVEGVSIDPETGSIFVADSINAGSYEFSAQVVGTGQYAGIVDAAVVVKVAQRELEGSFSYADGGNLITAEYGSSTGYSPTWSDLGVQTVGYSIRPETVGLLIAVDTGLVSISSTVSVGSYDVIVEAQGTGNYTGTIEQAITVTVTPKPITGTFSYESESNRIVAIAGGTQVSISFWVGGVGETVEYGYTSMPNAAGIAVDTSTGAISLDGTTPIGVYSLAITASGIGNYGGELTVNVILEVLAILPEVTVTYVEPVEGLIGNPDVTPYSPTVIVAPAAELLFSYSLQGTNGGEVPAGITLNETTGVISIDGKKLVGVASYPLTVVLVAEMQDLRTITEEIPITVDVKMPLGLLSYEAVAQTVGVGTVEVLPGWINPWNSSDTATRTATYTITPVTNGVSIDPNSGAISIPTDTAFVASYTVSAEGSGDFSGNGSDTVSVQIALIPTIEGDISYADIVGDYGSEVRGSVTGGSFVSSEDGSPITVSYSIGTPVEGVTIDPITGELVISEGVAPMELTQLEIVLDSDGHLSRSVDANLTVNRKSLGSSLVGSSAEPNIVGTVMTESETVEVLGSQLFLVGTDTIDQAVDFEIARYDFGSSGATTVIDAVTVDSVGGVKLGSGILVSDTGTYKLSAFGKERYQGTITLNLSITIDKATLEGTLAYDSATLPSSAYGDTVQYAPVAALTSSFGSTVYSISPNLPDEVVINSSSGVIEVGSIAGVFSGTYTVTASAPSHHSQSVDVTLTRGPMSIGGALVGSGTTLIEATAGTAVDSVQVLGGQTFLLESDTLNSAVNFTIARYDSGDSGSATPVAAVTIDTVGRVTVGSAARVADSGTYRITATGKVNYDGTATMNLPITIGSTTIGGTLSYGTGDLTSSYGEAAEHSLAEALTASFGTISYSLTGTPPTGVLVDPTTGVISVAGSVAPFSGTYTITASAPDHTSESVDVTIARSAKDVGTALVASTTTSISVVAGTEQLGVEVLGTQDFIVGSDLISSAVDFSIARYDSGDSGSATPVAAVTIDTEGRVSVASTALPANAGTYLITATGKVNYTGSATLNLSISIDNAAMEGTLSYGDDPLTSSYGTAMEHSRVGTLTASFGEVSYSTTTTLPAGVSLDATTGVISVAAGVAPFSAIVTITASAIDHASQSVNATITREGKSVGTTLVAATTTSITASAGTAAGPFEVLGTQTFLEGTDTLESAMTFTIERYDSGDSASTTSVAAVTIDAEGRVSVGSEARVGDTGTYRIVGSGTGNYTGSATLNLPITIENATIGGTLSYGTEPLTSSYGTEVSYSIAETLTPSFGTLSFSVNPVLPIGIGFDSDTGTITIDSGVVALTGTHTITASADGHDSQAIDITLTRNDRDVGTALVASTTTSITTPAGTAVADVVVLGSQTFLVGSDTLAGAVNFTIARYDSGNSGSATPVAAVTIDTVGRVTVGSAARVADSGTYRITATGKVNYDGTATLNLPITIENAAIGGTLSYGTGDLTSSYGEAAEHSLAEALTASFGTISYSVTGTPPTGVLVDTTTGVISVTGSVAPFSGTYTITASAPDHTSESVDVTIARGAKDVGTALVASTTTSISVVAGTEQLGVEVLGTQDFIVGSDLISSAVGFTIARYDSGDSGSATPVAAVTIDTEGRVSVASTALPANTGTYLITAIGEGNYAGSATLNLAIFIDNAAMEGTLSYGDDPLTSSYGTAMEHSRVGTLTASFGEVSYSLTGTPPVGVSVDATTGVISVAAGVAPFSETYTITASATDHASQSVDVTITREGKSVGDTLTASTTTTSITASAGTAAGPFEVLGTQTFLEGTDTLASAMTFTIERYDSGTTGPTTVVAAVTIDSEGSVSVGSEARVGDTGTYRIVGSGTGNYTGSATLNLPITIENATIGGTLSYGTEPLTSSYGTEVSYSIAETLTPSFGTLSFSVTPVLPIGIGFDSDTGTITIDSGVVALTGTHTITASADGHDGQTIDITLTRNDRDVGTALVASTTTSITTPAGTAVADVVVLGDQTFLVGSDALAGAVNFTIDRYDSGDSGSATPVAAVTIDTVGRVTVGSAARVADSGTYRITATGKVNYDGTATLNLPITIENAAIGGTLSYGTGDLTSSYGEAAEHSLAEALTASFGTISYSVTGTPPTGVSLDTTTGVISVAGSVTPFSETYTITASAPDHTSESVDVTIARGAKDVGTALVASTTTSISAVAGTEQLGVEVLGTQDFIVGSDLISSAVDFSIARYDSGDSGSATPVAAVTIDTEGRVSVASTALPANTGTYLITATGKVNYTGSATLNLSIFIDNAAMEGTLSYGDDPLTSSYGTAMEHSRVGTLTASFGEVSYSLTGTPPVGVSLDATTGVISVAAGVVPFSETYTITASATDHASQSVDVTITREGKSVGDTLTASTTTTSITASAGTAAGPFEVLGTQTFLEGTDTLASAMTFTIERYDSGTTGPTTVVAAVTIDSEGSVSVGSEARVGDTGTYRIVGSGTGNYTGSATLNLPITIENATIGGTLSYGTEPLTSSYGTEVSYSIANTLTPSFGTLSFSVTPVLPIGIGFDSDTGTITIDSGVVALTGTHTITASADGHDSQTIDITLTRNDRDVGTALVASTTTSITTPAGTAVADVVVLGDQTFLVGSDALSGAVNFTIDRYDSGDSGSATPVAAVTIDTVGRVTVGSAARVADSGTYRIMATGKVNYDGTATLNLPITIENATIGGTLSYASTTLTSTYGESANHDLTESLNSAFGTMSFSVTPNFPTNILLDMVSGRILVLSGASPFSGTYTITASAPDHESQSVDITLGIEPKMIDPTLTASTTTTIPVSLGRAVVDSEVLGTQAFLESGDTVTTALNFAIDRYDSGDSGTTTNVPAVTMNSEGKVSVGADAVVANSGTYKITATGKNSYTGTSTMNVEITISSIDINSFTMTPVHIQASSNYYLENGYVHSPVSELELTSPLATDTIEDSYTFALAKLDGENGSVVAMPAGVALRTTVGEKYKVVFDANLLPVIAGWYRLTVTGKGHYTGTRTLDFKVTAVWNPSNTYRGYTDWYDDQDYNKAWMGAKYGWTIPGAMLSSLSQTQTAVYSSVQNGGSMTLSGIRVQASSDGSEIPNSIRVGYILNSENEITFVTVNTSDVLPTPGAGSGTNPKANYEEIRWDPIENIDVIRVYPTNQFTAYPTIRFGLIVEGGTTTANRVDIDGSLTTTNTSITTTQGNAVADSVVLDTQSFLLSGDTISDVVDFTIARYDAGTSGDTTTVSTVTIDTLGRVSIDASAVESDSGTYKITATSKNSSYMGVATANITIGIFSPTPTDVADLTLTGASLPLSANYYLGDEYLHAPISDAELTTALGTFPVDEAFDFSLSKLDGENGNVIDMPAGVALSTSAGEKYKVEFSSNALPVATGWYRLSVTGKGSYTGTRDLEFNVIAVWNPTNTYRDYTHSYNPDTFRNAQLGATRGWTVPNDIRDALTETQTNVYSSFVSTGSMTISGLRVQAGSIAGEKPDNLRIGYARNNENEITFVIRNTSDLLSLPGLGNGTDPKANYHDIRWDPIDNVDVVRVYPTNDFTNHPTMRFGLIVEDATPTSERVDINVNLTTTNTSITTTQGTPVADSVVLGTQSFLLSGDTLSDVTDFTIARYNSGTSGDTTTVSTVTIDTLGRVSIDASAVEADSGTYKISAANTTNRYFGVATANITIGIFSPTPTDVADLTLTGASLPLSANFYLGDEYLHAPISDAELTTALGTFPVDEAFDFSLSKLDGENGNVIDMPAGVALSTSVGEKHKVEFSSNALPVATGWYRLSVTGKGSYTGTRDLEFNVIAVWNPTNTYRDYTHSFNSDDFRKAQLGASRGWTVPNVIRDALTATQTNVYSSFVSVGSMTISGLRVQAGSSTGEKPNSIRVGYARNDENEITFVTLTDSDVLSVSSAGYGTDPKANYHDVRWAPVDNVDVVRVYPTNDFTTHPTMRFGLIVEDATATSERVDINVNLTTTNTSITTTQGNAVADSVVLGTQSFLLSGDTLSDVTDFTIARYNSGISGDTTTVSNVTIDTLGRVSIDASAVEADSGTYKISAANTTNRYFGVATANITIGIFSPTPTDVADLTLTGVSLPLSDNLYIGDEYLHAPISDEELTTALGTFPVDEAFDFSLSKLDGENGSVVDMPAGVALSTSVGEKHKVEFGTDALPAVVGWYRLTLAGKGSYTGTRDLDFSVVGVWNPTNTYRDYTHSYNTNTYMRAQMGAEYGWTVPNTIRTTLTKSQTTTYSSIEDGGTMTLSGIRVQGRSYWGERPDSIRVGYRLNGSTDINFITIGAPGEETDVLSTPITQDSTGAQTSFAEIRWAPIENVDVVRVYPTDDHTNHPTMRFGLIVE